MRGRICVLSGGTGTPKLLQGLVEVMDPADIDIIVNTADDIEVDGAYVSPDVDAVLYTLAGIIDEERWYGIRNDTFLKYEDRCRRGFRDLLRLGDGDRKNCEDRARIMSRGKTLSEAIDRQRERLGVRPGVYPMTDSRVTTMIKTPLGTKEFQEYWVRDGGRDEVLGVEFRGISQARISEGGRISLERAGGVLVGPSNPVTSIGPILRVGGFRELLSEKYVVAISPIKGGSPFSGPLGNMLTGLGYEVSSLTVARLYSYFLDYLILDTEDEPIADQIEDEFGIQVGLADTGMKTPGDKFKLARTALAACREGEVLER